MYVFKLSSQYFNVKLITFTELLSIYTNFNQKEFSVNNNDPKINV